MKKFKFVSIVLCLCFIITLFVPALATETSAKLTNIYGNNMVFKQNDDVIIAGTGTTGSSIKASLYTLDDQFVVSGTTTVNADGTFEVTFLAPKGGFTEYKIILKENDNTFRILNNVVFGELWLASGQSNMQYYLLDDIGFEDVKNSNYGNEWIRHLIVPLVPAINGKEIAAAEEMDDIEGCYWIKDNDEKINMASAVSYYFAQALCEKINMPVGIIDSNMGGSIIASWISRDRIDGNAQAVEALKKSDLYISADNKDASNESFGIAGTMCANYNAKTSALRHFRISGMIWYQGESDLLLGINSADYTNLFNLLQEEITETFSFKNGPCPIVYTQLAVYGPYGYDLQEYNANFAEIEKLDPSSRACITNYDITPTYNETNGSIHPNIKKPVGDRMALAASGLVYKQTDTFSSTFVKSSKINGDAVEATLANVGDGLKFKGDIPFDFAICGEDGIEYKATAKIISKDTVSISSKEVANPVSASYAMTSSNLRANLYITKGGEYIMPLTPFITDKSMLKAHYNDRAWTDMETESGKAWDIKNGDSGLYQIWTPIGCSAKVKTESAFDGNYGLNVSSILKNFSITRNFFFNRKEAIPNENTNWSNYKSLSFKVKNNGDKDVTINSVILQNSLLTFCSARLNGTNNDLAVIPADNVWHTVEIDLNSLNLFGIGLFKVNSSVLKNLRSISLNFTSDCKSSSIDIDCFEFSSTLHSEQNGEITSHSFIWRFVTTIIDIIKKF